MRAEVFMIMLWQAITTVEGDPAGQITPICYQDTKADNPFSIFIEYSQKYCETYTPEEISRVWNGGPKGASKKATVKYWRKVLNEMDKTRASQNRREIFGVS